MSQTSVATAKLWLLSPHDNEANDLLNRGLAFLDYAGKRRGIPDPRANFLCPRELCMFFRSDFFCRLRTGKPETISPFLSSAVRSHTFASCVCQFGWLRGSRKLLKRKDLLVAAGGFEPPTLWVMRSDSPFDESRTVPPTRELAIQSLRLPQFQGLGSVLPYRSRDVGTDFDE